MTATFVASSSWCPDRPRTLVICCSDGRWHASIIDFVHTEVDDRADLYAVPGGPASCDPWSSSFDEARVLESALRLFEEHHDLTSIWLIAHEACAYYRARHPGEDADGIRRRQMTDLHRAHELLRIRFPRLDVRLVFAELEGERILFRTLAPHAALHG